MTAAAEIPEQMKRFLDWYAGLIERLPVPERSGFKGTVLMLSLLWFVFVPFPNGNDGGLLDSALCTIMPWKCLAKGIDEKRWAAFEARKAGRTQRPWRLVSNVYLDSADTVSQVVRKDALAISIYAALI